jgi:hypothetical protein
MRARNRKFVGAEVPWKLKDIVKQYAFHNHKSQSEVIRDILMSYFSFREGVMDVNTNGRGEHREDKEEDEDERTN